MKRIIRNHLRHRVIVTLRTGAAFGGVLYEADSEAVVLKDATALESNGTDRVAVPADGSMVFLRDNIDYLQFP